MRMLRYRISRRELKDVSYGIVIGKLSTYIANCVGVRLHSDEPVTGPSAALQVILNDLARVLTGHRRRDHVKMEELLKCAELPSVNQLVARSAINMMWTGLVASKGPLVSVLRALRPASNTRAANNGKLNSPATSNINVIIDSGVRLWNLHHDKIVAAKNKPALKKLITKEIWPSLPI